MNQKPENMHSETGQTHHPRWHGHFIFSCAIILALTGCAKIWAAMGKAQILDMQDELLILRNRELMLGVGLLEIIIAVVLFRGRDILFSALILFWVSANFALYRFGMLFTKSTICPCLGHIHQALHLRPEVVDGVLKLVICYNLIGSSLIAHYYRQRIVSAFPDFVGSLLRFRRSGIRIIGVEAAVKETAKTGSKKY